MQLRGGHQQLGGRLGPALVHQQLRQERRPLQSLGCRLYSGRGGLLLALAWVSDGF